MRISKTFAAYQCVAIARDGRQRESRVAPLSYPKRSKGNIGKFHSLFIRWRNMSVVSFFTTIGFDLKTLILSIAGAGFGALVKWLLDLNLIQRMSEENKTLVV